VVTPPQIPADVRAEATAQGVQLAWRAEGAAFRIFRRSGKEDFMPAGDASQSPWTDTSSVFGMPYTYRVQTILKLEDNREAESDLSAAISITPQDRFPPAVPIGLRATAAGDSVELSWEGNTEGDLAGYRVYRAEGAGAFQKIADSAIPAYADHAVEHGKSYRYEVTSLDQSGNESTPSPVADIALE
jgi:fibronectin type 3 domain-containing protein